MPIQLFSSTRHGSRAISPTLTGSYKLVSNLSGRFPLPPILPFPLRCDRIRYTVWLGPAQDICAYELHPSCPAIQGSEKLDATTIGRLSLPSASSLHSNSQGCDPKRQARPGTIPPFPGATFVISSTFRPRAQNPAMTISRRRLQHKQQQQNVLSKDRGDKASGASTPSPRVINAAPSLEKAEMYGIDDNRPVFSRAMALAGRVFIETIPQWLTVGAMLALIFGGCCSNVFALESIIKVERESGTYVRGRSVGGGRGLWSSATNLCTIEKEG